MNENSKPLSTVRPFGDPCAGDLITPVNSNIAVRSLINLLPMYRQGLSNRARGLQLGSFFGFVLYGPFTVLGPMRNSDYSTTIGLFSTIGGVSILTTLFFLYGQAGGRFYQPPANPTVPNPPKELFNSESWSQLQVNFWLGGCLGAIVAWFIYSNEFIMKLYQISTGS